MSDIDFSCWDVDLPANFSKNKISSWLRQVTELELRSIDTLQYIFCTDSHMLHLNRTHLRHDSYTDILTFPYSSNPLEAEIYISLDRVAENARTFDTEFHTELCRVIVHGILHMCGHDDKTPDEKKRMHLLESNYLKLLEAGTP